MPDDKTKTLDDRDIYPDRQAKRHIIYGQLSDVGLTRKNNEDGLYSILATPSVELPDFGVFIVADGMGGQIGGEKASAISCRIVMGSIANQILLPLLDPDADRPIMVDALREAFQAANTAVVEYVPGGGSTTTAVAIMGNLAYIAHVGDSRAYLIENGQIEQLTRDHSLAAKLVEIGQLDPQEAMTNRNLTQIYAAMGSDENIDPEIITRRLAARSQLLLCSDGLWGLIPNDQLLHTVLNSPSPQEACETLVKMANEAGGTDNISVIVVRMPE